MGRSNNLGAGCSTAYEKDGAIYVMFYYNTDGFLGSPCHYYILKYHFETHSTEYHTSILFEEYPDHIKDLYIQ